jgi:predicted transcriptional regulator
MENIFQNRTNRFNLLLAIYHATDASYEHTVNVQLLAAQVGLNGAQLRKAVAYLLEEGLLRAVDLGGQASEQLASLTHKGAKAVEEVFIDQYQATYYFPAYREMRS